MLTPLDLHVLSTPPAFVLSQDQTLQEFNKARPNWLATRYVASSPNHFLVRQCSLPGSPDRVSRIDESASHFHQRSIQLSNSTFRLEKPARLEQPSIVPRPCFPVKWLQATHLLSSLHPTPVKKPASVAFGDPNPSIFDPHRKWGKWAIDDGQLPIDDWSQTHNSQIAKSPIVNCQLSIPNAP